MYQQNIPCASQVSTSALVGSGVSGLGARRFRRPVRRGVAGYMQQSGQVSTSNLFASGLGCGCRGLGCRCNGLGDGLTMDGTGLFGTGLFSGGLDVSNWTVGVRNSGSRRLCVVLSLPHHKGGVGYSASEGAGGSKGVTVWQPVKTFGRLTV